MKVKGRSVRKLLKPPGRRRWGPDIGNGKDREEGRIEKKSKLFSGFWCPWLSNN